MSEEEEFRAQLDGRQKISNKKYNQVYVFQMKHKLSASYSYLYFVKVAGSEKLIKNGLQNEQKRLQDQIIQNN